MHDKESNVMTRKNREEIWGYKIEKPEILSHNSVRCKWEDDSFIMPSCYF